MSLVFATPNVSKLDCLSTVDDAFRRQHSRTGEVNNVVVLVVPLATRPVVVSVS